MTKFIVFFFQITKMVFIVKKQGKKSDHESHSEQDIEKSIHRCTVLIGFIDLVLCAIVRLAFVLQGVFYIYFLVSYEKNYGYLGMIAGLITIIIDGIYVMVKRKGKEYSW